MTLKRGKNNCNTNWYNKQNDIVSQNSCEINVNESNCGILNIQNYTNFITYNIKSTYLLKGSNLFISIINPNKHDTKDKPILLSVIAAK